MFLNLNTARIIVGGSSVIGIGALMYYGSGWSPEVPRITDNLRSWPSHVWERLKSVAGRVGISFVRVAMSQYVVCMTPQILYQFESNIFAFHALTTVSLITNGVLFEMLSLSINHQGIRRVLWLSHAVLQGILTAPVLLINSGTLLRSMMHTSVIVAGISLLAACAPRGIFFTNIKIHPPYEIVIRYGEILMSRRCRTNQDSVIHSMFLHGGLVVYAVMLLYFSQRTIFRSFEEDDTSTFDISREALPLVSCTLNIFLRLVLISSPCPVYFSEVPINLF